MPDTSEPRATLPFPSGPDQPAESEPADPLLGDWAEGLRGPVREVPIKRPRRIRGQTGPTPRPIAQAAPSPGEQPKTEQADLRILAAMAGALQSAPPEAAHESEVEAPDAWASTDDQLASLPPPPRAEPEAPLAAAPADVAALAEGLAVETPVAAPAVPTHDTDETLHPLTPAQLAGEPAVPSVAAAPAAEAAAEQPVEQPAEQGQLAEQPVEEVLLLSDAELAEDEPPAPAEPLAQQEAEAASSDAAGAPAAGETVEPAPAAALEVAAAGAAVGAATEAAGPDVEAASAGSESPAAAPAEAAAAPLPETAALAAQPQEAATHDEPPGLPFAHGGPAEDQQPEVAAQPEAPASGVEEAPTAGFYPAIPAHSPEADPLAGVRPAASDLAVELTSDLDAALEPVASAHTGESLPVALPDAQVPAEGARALFTAPTVAPNAGWAPPEPALQQTGETAPALLPVHSEPGPDATVHEGAPITLPAAAVSRPAPGLGAGPLQDDDLENTVLSLAMESMQRHAAPAAAQAPAPAALEALAEEEFEQLPEDAIAEPLPEDAIAGTADPAAPWNHAEIEVAVPHPAPSGHSAWDSGTSTEWQPSAGAAPWDAAPAHPSAPWAGGGAHASEAWPGAAARAAPAESWGAPAAPAHEAWGAAPAPAAVAWGEPAPAARSHEWGAPAAAAPVHTEWAAEPAGPFSADKLVSSPGASDWVIETAPPPAASAWGAPPAAAEAWEARTQAGFPITVPAAPAGSPFAPLAPGAMLSPDDSSPGLLAQPKPEDLDLPVPIYEPEPVQSSSHLAVPGEHRVAVHTRAGRTRRGLVRDVDLAGTGFSLQPQNGGGAPESVQAAEVKAVFFMLQPGEKPPQVAGAKVRVTFEDGRTIEGLRDGADAPEGFFLVPSDAARTNTRRIFVARGAVQELREG